MSMQHEASMLDWSSCTPVCIFEQGCPSLRYLAFARADIDDHTGARSWVNAVSNAKRALHLRVENLVDAYGGGLLQSKLTDFPRKLEFCGRCGVISPSILRRLNSMRNKIEHEYTIPTDEEALDYVDIVDLFLEATSWLVHKFPENLELECHATGKRMRIICIPQSGLINVSGADGTIEVAATKDRESYIAWMRVILDKARQSHIGP